MSYRPQAFACFLPTFCGRAGGSDDVRRPNQATLASCSGALELARAAYSHSASFGSAYEIRHRARSASRRTSSHPATTRSRRAAASPGSRSGSRPSSPARAPGLPRSPHLKRIDGDCSLDLFVIRAVAVSWLHPILKVPPGIAANRSVTPLTASGSAARAAGEAVPARGIPASTARLQFGLRVSGDVPGRGQQRSACFPWWRCPVA